MKGSPRSVLTPESPRSVLTPESPRPALMPLNLMDAEPVETDAKAKQVEAHTTHTARRAAAAEAAARLPPGDESGALVKQGQSFPWSWKVRYFELSRAEGSLTYWASRAEREAGAQLLGRLLLAGAEEAEGGGGCALVFRAKDREPLHARASSPAVRARWVDAVGGVVSALLEALPREEKLTSLVGIPVESIKLRLGALNQVRAHLKTISFS